MKKIELLLGALRVSLAIVFIWFGLLKVWGYNPVHDLIYHSLAPFMATGSGLVALGVFETLLGVLLLSNRFVKFTHILLVLHLIGTFSTFVFGWHVIFQPFFPVLSLEGEFVVKNLVLIIAALVIFDHETRSKKI